MSEPSGSTGAEPSAEAVRASLEAEPTVVPGCTCRWDADGNPPPSCCCAELAAAYAAEKRARGLVAAYSIDAPAIHAEGVAEGRRAAMEEFTDGVNFCSAHRERQEGCPVCWPDLTGLVAEHRQVAEAKGRAAGRDEALREVVALIRLNASNEDGYGALVLNLLADAIEAAFPTTGDPIPAADLERAREYVRERGWVKGAAPTPDKEGELG